jgi:hypothetical protein
MEQVLASWPYLKREAVEEAVQLVAAAWPELMRDEAAQALQHLAGALAKREPHQADSPHEPVRSGLPA